MYAFTEKEKLRQEGDKRKSPLILKNQRQIEFLKPKSEAQGKYNKCHRLLKALNIFYYL